MNQSSNHILRYKCTFLSDVVLNADTATEGNQQSLDYIPGSCFLGIVAKKYNDFSNAYKIFHSGKVKFGDAHIAKDNKRSLKRPASWFYEKGKDDKDIYLHHLITDEQRKEFQRDGIQLKQVRSGYFTGKNILKADHYFAIKSAYNVEERRSAEGQLYGYDALRKGSEWIFSVEAEDENLLKEIKTVLSGNHNIGRSKTAQYGRVKIEIMSDFEPNDLSTNDNNALTILYFESCAAFLDEDGNPTYQPSEEDLGILSGSIDWAKSQILRRTYAPYNAIRKVRDADRVCIDKGSVVVVNGNVNYDKIASGVGVYQNEGFGKILVNPDFLKSEKGSVKIANPPEMCKNESAVSGIVKVGNDDKNIIDWLKSQSNIQSRYSEVVEKTNNFIKDNSNKFSRISPSQWGSIRERAQRISNLSILKDELFKDTSGYLRHGKEMDKWRNNWRILKDAVNECEKLIARSFLKDAVNECEQTIARRFLINLCSEMAKKKNKKDK